MAERKQASRTSVGGGPSSQADAEPQRSQDEGTLEQPGGKPMGRAPSGEPDVHLDVPSLHVGEIAVDVERLEAHLALRAQLAGLVNLVAGAHVGVDKVRIEIKDVDAEAMLKVRLENTYNIFDRTLTTLDESPELMQYLHETADGAVEQMDDSSQDTKAGGAVGELTSGAGDKLGDLPDTVGDTLSSAGGKASPKRMLGGGSKRSGGEPEGSGGEPEESSGEPTASGGGAIAKGAAAAGAAGAAGLAGAALLRKRPRRRILGIPIGRQNGIAALAKQIGDAGDQVAKAAKISKEIDKVRKTAQQALKHKRN